MDEDAKPRVPEATYRVQLNGSFTFEKLVAIIPYLDALGVSDVYSSPFFVAVPGSTHGYDVCDQNQISQEIGGMKGLCDVSAQLKARGMGLLLDFVPNHMGIQGPNNWRWLDVLENGRHTLYGDFFDIHWNPPQASLQERVLVPMLHDFYGAVLEQGEIRLEYQDGSFCVCYRSLRFPLKPSSYGKVLQRLAWFKDPGSPVSRKIEMLAEKFNLLQSPCVAETLQEADDRRKLVGNLRAEMTHLITEARLHRDLQTVLVALNGKKLDPLSFDSLHEILETQHYRLAYWKSGIHEVNYRRFFAIDTLVGIHMESQLVFDDTHKLLKELVDKKIVTGLRIDHVDGLWDPLQYLRRLAALPAENSRPLYVLVEKILTPGETIPEEWALQGTTGYEFVSCLINLLLPVENREAFTKTYQEFIGESQDPAVLTSHLKRFIMEEMFPNVIKSLAETLVASVKNDRRWRDWSSDDLREAISEIAASFGVYRTYRRVGETTAERDLAVIEQAVEATLKNQVVKDAKALQFIRDLLSGRYPDPSLSKEQRKWADEWVCKFQQYTGAIMAKSVEDTFFYRYVRLFGANDVGHDPGEFGASVDAFHAANQERALRWPGCMLTTSTHDTKTSEDTRARLLALSGMPEKWNSLVRQWHADNLPHKAKANSLHTPSNNEEYLLYQILCATWPLEGEPDATFRERIKAYMRKAIAESKTDTDWAVPSESHLMGSDAFVEAILDPEISKPFWSTFVPFAAEVAAAGMIFSLTQTTLKLTVPGVPDIYQGCEMWDFSLVDPDNRRPVDFETRRVALNKVKGASAETLIDSWKDGRIKLFLTQALLRFRKDHPSLFRHGSYEAVALHGPAKDQFVAFRREHEGQHLLVLATVRVHQKGGPDHKEANLSFPSEMEWKNILSPARIPRTMSVPVGELLGKLPVGVFHAESVRKA